MQIIEGRNVDLLFPFPQKEYKRILSWVHCYRTVLDIESYPKTEAEIAEYYNRPNIKSFGIIDKNNILNIRHEAPLIGVWVLERFTDHIFDMHVISTRKAWGSRLVDQAGQLLIDHAFETNPALNRVSGLILSSNAPAKALAKRLGLQYEGCLHDAMVVKGVPANVAIFGLTRRTWSDPTAPCHDLIEPVPINKPKLFDQETVDAA